jgi:hypothetical protein
MRESHDSKAVIAFVDVVVVAEDHAFHVSRITVCCWLLR